MTGVSGDGEGEVTCPNGHPQAGNGMVTDQTGHSQSHHVDTDCMHAA